MLSNTFIRAYRFFRDHAGGLVGHSARIAFDYATAEQEVEARGWSFEWVWDECVACDEFDPPAKEVLGCVLKDDTGEPLASLWGIADPSRSYRRVVQAELADEALHNLKSAAQSDAAAHTFQAL